MLGWVVIHGGQLVVSGQADSEQDSLLLLLTVVMSVHPVINPDKLLAVLT